MSTVVAQRTRSSPWLPLGVVAAAGGAAVVLARVDPYAPGHYPTCPFLALTGWYCPGCGSLRGLHDLLHGDVAGMAARNPMLLLAVPYLALALGAWLLRRAGWNPPRSTSAPPWVIWAVFVLVIAFGVLRNLPGMSWLSPA